MIEDVDARIEALFARKGISPAPAPVEVVIPADVPVLDAETAARFTQEWRSYCDETGTTTQPSVADLTAWIERQQSSPQEQPQAEPLGDSVEPSGKEAAFLVPWSDDERREFQAWCRSRSRNYETVSDEESVDWLRHHRGLPPIPRPVQPPMMWHPGEYSGRKSIWDFENESRPDGFTRPGRYGGGFGGGNVR